MAHHVHFSFEPGVSFHEQPVYLVGFFADDFGYLLSVCALVQQNIEGKIRDEGPRKGHALDRDIFQRRI